MIGLSNHFVRSGRCRKMTMRGHGSMTGGTVNDMPPPPVGA